MSTKRHVTAGTKKLVAGRQRYICAATIKDYKCPLNGYPFDEAGYEVDHIISLADGGTNDASNLQALCLMCHRVKTNRATVGKPKKTVGKKSKGFVYTGPTMSDSDSDFSEDDKKVYYYPDDAAKMPFKIQSKKSTNELKFGLWRKQNMYSDFPDNNGYYWKQR